MPRLMLCSMSLLLFLPLSVQAAAAITCHCFTDRTYDPSRPALADPYFLAATQNSFFAVLFNVDKKKIVMKKQAGSSADDLWVAYWLATGSGSTGEALLVARGEKGSWKEVIVPMGLPASSLGERFVAEITTGASSARLAQVIVDDVLVRHRILGEQELTTLREGRASNQEVIITALIAVKTGRPAIEIYRNVKKGTKSWGTLLGEAKIKQAEMPAEFVRLLNKKGTP